MTLTSNRIKEILSLAARTAAEAIDRKRTQLDKDGLLEDSPDEPWHRAAYLRIDEIFLGDDDKLVAEHFSPASDSLIHGWDYGDSGAARFRKFCHNSVPDTITSESATVGEVIVAASQIDYGDSGDFSVAISVKCWSGKDEITTDTDKCG